MKDYGHRVISERIILWMHHVNQGRNKIKNMILLYIYLRAAKVFLSNTFTQTKKRVNKSSNTEISKSTFGKKKNNLSLLLMQKRVFLQYLLACFVWMRLYILQCVYGEYNMPCHLMFKWLKTIFRSWCAPLD